MSRNLLLIVVGAGVLLVALVLVFLGVLPGLKQSRPDPVTLQFWGVEDDEDVWREIIGNYRDRNPHITINYTRIDPNTYEDMLINRIAEGRGPDIFMLGNSLVPKHKGKIYPLPENGVGINAKTYRKFFVDVAADDLATPEGDVLGLPLYIDTPVLLYNRDIFNAAAISEPPKIWDSVLEISKRLTVTNPAGDIVKSGISMGTFQNIEHAYEVINSMFLQTGDPVIDRRTGQVVLGPRAAGAFRFFASFADPLKQNYSWSGRMQNSLAAFSEERAAMTFGLAGDLERIKARNPHLSLRISEFPQPKDARTPAVFGTYYFPTVSKSSLHPIESWQFLLYTASKDVAKLYADKAKRAPARLDLLSASAPSGELQIFYKQALIAKDWPTPDDRTTRRIFKDIIDSSAGSTAGPDEKVNRLREQLLFLRP